MFDKILIANRGEITCRIIATAHLMGIKTVAVYSDADRDAKHVRMADEAYHIGSAPSAASYLLSDKIIAVAKQSGAQAIHPGYGFLSENPAFVSKVEQAGLKFIGPSADAITKMGLKDRAKSLMEQAGVPVVPGYHGDSQDTDLLRAEAEKIGYPVLIKARAGGGGKGMRLVETPDEFDAAFAAAAREGQASFNDPVCLLEKYIENPRHIEVQVFGDKHGNVVHMYERDCSLQRRHQKVIEEAPAPGMTPDVRAAICDAAVCAAKAINYEGAGTIEFIADGSNGLRADGFWFMEMNTRLQVEHPVSEAITGLDFVELQLRIAAGAPIPLTQDEIPLNGHAVEARIYAEDAVRGFLPSIGTIASFETPTATNFAHGAVRFDSAVEVGDAISSFYDPMISKLITYGADRKSAMTRMADALANTHIQGVTTNLDFLSALIAHPEFAAGKFDTGLIERNAETLVAPPETDALVTAIAAIASIGLLPSNTKKSASYSHWVNTVWPAYLTRDGAEISAQVRLLAEGTFDVDGAELRLTPRNNSAFQAEHNGVKTTVNVMRGSGGVTVGHNATNYHFLIPDPFDRTETDDRAEQIRAPMPGLVQSLPAKPGQAVAKGDILIVLEAMKMEHSLSAPAAGTVARLHIKQGQQVDDGALLVELEFNDE